jgi:outer membrane murein-binding lipoprotein Lpp
MDAERATLEAALRACEKRADDVLSEVSTLHRRLQALEEERDEAQAWKKWAGGRKPDDPLLKDYNQMIVEVRAAERRCAQLEAALRELLGHCSYALDTTGQRTRPPMFVPSVAKRVKEIVDAALAGSEAGGSQETRKEDR